MIEAAKSIRKYSSAMQPEPRLIPRVWTTSTMHSLLSMMDVILLVSRGMKLNEMIENGEITEDQAKMGYVGAYTYAEVISGYTSYFLGARSVCPERYHGSNLYRFLV